MNWCPILGVSQIHHGPYRNQEIEDERTNKCLSKIHSTALLSYYLQEAEICYYERSIMLNANTGKSTLCFSLKNNWCWKMAVV